MMILAVALWFGVEVEPMCFASDVRALCCPSACAAKNTPGKWTQADEMLRSCARSIGCKSVESWTVGMRCECRC